MSGLLRDGPGARWNPAGADAGLLVLRLIGAGHTPADAERWAADTVPAWSAVSEETRTDFAITVLGVWHHMTRVDPGPQRAPLVDVARRWVAYRLGDVAAPLVVAGR